MKKLKRFIKALVLVIPFLLTLSCNNDDEKTPAQKDLASFEKEYSQSLNYKSNETLKLIGFKKIELEEADVADFNAFYEQNKDNLKNYFYDKPNAVVKIYFPVEAALVEHHDELLEASELGEVDMNISDSHITHLFVVGRKQTESITGVEGNIIKDGVIYLAEKAKVDHSNGKLHVFDFGVKHIGHDHSHGKVASGETSCMNNHGGRNCSNAFGIYKGRCAFNSRVCMDYNGWFTNCVNGKWSNFPGSDCDYALGAGHCWNEIM
jgi:hypothetical protein